MGFQLKLFQGLTQNTLVNNLVISNIKGGFGNQLFQYAVGYSVARHFDSSLKVDLSFYAQPKFASAFKLDKLKVNLINATIEEIGFLKSVEPTKSIMSRITNKLKFAKYNKSSHYKDENGFKSDINFWSITTPIYLEGWFLKPTYFDKFRNELLDIFLPNFQFSEKATPFLADIKNCNSVAIHLRRTDYVNNPIFRVLDSSYYRRAMHFIKEKQKSVKFYIFSDDIEWCKKNIPSSSDIYFVENSIENSDLVDFFLMKNCKHNIIANSSFSWWAAYLNENKMKQVVAPKLWFNDYFFQNSLDNNPGFLMDWVSL